MYQKLNNRNVARGRESRALILAALNQQPTLTRDELMRVTQLSYDQVRDQCQQLSIAGEISSTIGQRGERRYALKKMVAASGCVGLVGV